MNSEILVWKVKIFLIIQGVETPQGIFAFQAEAFHILICNQFQLS